MNKDYLIKEYSIQNLIAPQKDVLGRISSIENITKETICPVIFEIQKDKIIRITKKIKDRNHLYYGKLKKHQLYQLAAQMDVAFQKDVTHGDLNRKNIIIDTQENLCVSDWEPDLKQYINGKKSYMVTSPWVDKEDIKKDNISINTDLMCFFRCISNKKKTFFYLNEWTEIALQAKISGNPFSFVLNKNLLEKETINE